MLFTIKLAKKSTCYFPFLKFPGKDFSPVVSNDSFIHQHHSSQNKENNIQEKYDLFGCEVGLTAWIRSCYEFYLHADFFGNVTKKRKIVSGCSGNI